MLSDAQLWIDLSREYPAEVQFEAVDGRGVPAIPADAESPSNLSLGAFQGVSCFTCQNRPAGFGDWYRHSAYCAHCQPMPDMNGIPPYGYSRPAWIKRLNANREEIIAYQAVS